MTVLIKCIVCNKNKRRTTKKSQKNIRNCFYSPNGKSWPAYNICSDHKKAKTLKFNIITESSWEPPTLHSTKKCTCGNPVHLSRYNTCLTCKPYLPSDESPSYLTMREKTNFKISEMSQLAGGLI